MDTPEASLWVGVMLPPALARQFPPPAAPDVDVQMPPHITVVYARMDEDRLQVAARVVRDVVANAEPVPVRIGRLGHFDNDGETAAWAAVDAPDLATLREIILARLRANGIGAEQTHPEYTPHTTIAYLPPGERWAGAVPSGEFVAGAFAVWLDGEWADVVHVGGGHWPADMAKASASITVEWGLTGMKSPIRAGMTSDIYLSGGARPMDDLQKAIDGCVAKAGEMTDEERERAAAALEKAAGDVRKAKKTDGAADGQGDGAGGEQAAPTAKAAPVRWPADMARDL